MLGMQISIVSFSRGNVLHGHMTDSLTCRRCWAEVMSELWRSMRKSRRIRVVRDSPRPSASQMCRWSRGWGWRLEGTWSPVCPVLSDRVRAGKWNDTWRPLWTATVALPVGRYKITWLFSRCFLLLLRRQTWTRMFRSWLIFHINERVRFWLLSDSTSGIHILSINDLFFQLCVRTWMMVRMDVTNSVEFGT